MILTTFPRIERFVEGRKFNFLKSEKNIAWNSHTSEKIRKKYSKIGEYSSPIYLMDLMECVSPHFYPLQIKFAYIFDQTERLLNYGNQSPPNFCPIRDHGTATVDDPVSTAYRH